MPHKVLLVDDVNFFLELEKNYLGNTDCEVYTATNGRDALSIALETSPDLTILDYEMPVMNGMEYLEAVGRHDGLRQSPVVVVSAFADAALEARLADAGAARVLKKPFSEAAFVDVVETFLKIDKRKKERFAVEIPAFFGFQEKMEKGVIVDMSESGLFLATDAVMPENSFLELKFLPPGAGDPIRLWVRVVWVNEGKRAVAGRPRGMGLVFSGLSKEALDVIRHFLGARGDGSQGR